MLGKCDFHSSKFVSCIFSSFFSLCPLAKLSKQVPPPLPLSPNFFLHPFILCCPFSSQSFWGAGGTVFHLNCQTSTLKHVHLLLSIQKTSSSLPSSPLCCFIHSFFSPYFFFSSYPDDFLSSDSSGVQHFLLPLLVLAQTSVNKRALCWTFPAKLHSGCSIKD